MLFPSFPGVGGRGQGGGAEGRLLSSCAVHTDFFWPWAWGPEHMGTSVDTSNKSDNARYNKKASPFPR